MTEPSRPKPASSVILLRPAIDGGFEVFMTRRPQGMDFLGGMYVFAGGSVRKDDCSEGLFRRCRGLSKKEAREILGAHLSPDLSLGHWVAGIRELFEEAGVLLCADEKGRPVDMNEDGRRTRIAEKRIGLIEEAVDFLSLLESEGLFCDAGRLAYFSHWQTPEVSPIRFNAHFYLARLPPDQSPLPTSEEVTHSLWLSPERSLELCRQGSLPVIFPTYASLRALADFDTLEQLRDEYGLK